jgi:zinc D-Ala-D-Ala carboxypeptidase
MRLSPHFTLGEMTKSQTALRMGLDNDPDEPALDALTTLCVEALEPIREHFGRPVVVNSGYRSPNVNRAIGGASTSQHCKGEAADIEVPGLDNQELYLWAAENIDFDQLILEYYTGEESSGWVHVSYVSHETNRRDRLRIDKSGVRRD